MMIKLAKKTLVVLNSYDIRWKRKLWHALTSEKAAFGSGGQEAFANYVYDTICMGIQNTDVVLPCGEPCDPAKHFPNSKTFKNFLALNLSAPEVEYQGTPKTFQAIHTFLWIKKPTRVERWNNPNNSAEYTKYVDGIDDTFDFLLPHEVLPQGFRLFRRNTEEMVDLRDVRQLMNDFNHVAQCSHMDAVDFLHKHYPDDQKGLQFIGTVCRLDNDINERAVAFGTADWMNLETLFLNSRSLDTAEEKLDLIQRLQPSGSVFFKDKAITHPHYLAVDHDRKLKPYVNRRYGFWVLKRYDVFRQEEVFDSFGPIKLEGDAANFRKIFDDYGGGNQMLTERNYVELLPFFKLNNVDAIAVPLTKHDLEMKYLINEMYKWYY